MNNVFCPQLVLNYQVKLKQIQQVAVFFFFNSRLMSGMANVVTRSGSQKTKLPHFCCNLFVCRSITVYFWLRVWKFGLHIAPFLDYLENHKTKEKNALSIQKSTCFILFVRRNITVSYFLYVGSSLFHTFCMSEHHCFILFVCRNITVSYSLYVGTSLFHTFCMSEHHCFILLLQSLFE